MNDVIEWCVGPVKRRKGKYCFHINLQLSEETIVRQDGGYLFEEEADIQREYTIGKLSKGEYAIYGNIRVYAFYEHWLEKIKKPMLAYHSYNSYKNCIKNYIVPLYGNLQMEKITKAHIKRLYQKTYEQHPSIARILKTVLSDSMKYAKRHGYVSEDFITGLKWSREISNRSSEKPEKRALSVEEIKRMLVAARDTDIYLPILFSVFMGLRRSEIVGLKYTDIDYEKRQIYIQRQLGVDNSVKKSEVEAKTYTKQEMCVKTPSSRRKLEMPVYVFQAVMEERVRYERRRNRRKKEFQDADYIYCSSYGRPRTSNYLWKKLRDFISDNELSYTTWRGLRYTYTTTILKAGYGLAAVSRTLGHTRKEFTADVYVDKKELIKDEQYLNNIQLKERAGADDTKVLAAPLTDEMKLLLEFVNTN